MKNISIIKWLEERWNLSWLITILIAMTIFIFSSLTFETSISEGAKSALPIIYHICAFFFLSLFLFISLVNGKENFLLFFTAFLLSIAYGITDEIHQFFVPGRFCSIIDVGFDAIGVIFASIIYLISLKYRKVKK